MVGAVVRRRSHARLSCAFLLGLFSLFPGISLGQGEPGIHWEIEPPLPGGRDFELTSEYGEGSSYYLDRDYVFVSFHETLAGGFLLRTYNDLKYDSLVVPEDRDRWVCRVWVDRPMAVYLLWDRRTLNRVPLWLWNGRWELTPLVQHTTDYAMDFFAVLRKIVAPGDTLALGHPMAEGVPTPSMYVLIFSPIVGLGTTLPRGYRLGPLYPNPARSSLQIPFELLDRVRVRIRVWDVRGRTVSTIIDGYVGPGVHAVRWDLQDGRGIPVPSGVYLLQLDASPFWVGVTKLSVIR